MPSPLFIVGSGRCGSTWLYSILRQHPGIALTNEAKVIDFLYFCAELAAVPVNRRAEFFTNETVEMRGLVHADYVDTFVTVFHRHVKAICEDFYATQFAGRDYAFWGDKLPDPRAAATARWVWPDARYLVLVRDPRDVLCSWWAFAKRADIARDDPKLVGVSAQSLADSWRLLYSGVLEQLDGALQVRYEDLRADPRPRVAEILAWLGLPWVNGLDAELDAGQVFASHGTAATPAATIGRWQRELSQEDIRTVERVCGPLMQRFGYVLTDR